MQSFIGTGVALVTPFKKDFSVDVEALTRIVNYVIIFLIQQAQNKNIV